MFLFVILICACFQSIHLDALNGGAALDQPLSSTAGFAADLSFDFQDDLEGWGEATIPEAHAVVDQFDGILRITAEGSSTYVDSPIISIPLQERHTFVTRYRSLGGGSRGKFQLTTANASNTFHVELPLKVKNDGLWHTELTEITVPQSISPLKLLRIRMFPALPLAEGSAFHIDSIHLIRVPIIKRVTGCSGEMYSNSSSFDVSYYDTREQTIQVGDALFARRTKWRHSNLDLEYGRSYNCLRAGGENILIEGLNFGEGGLHGIGSPALVAINDEPCTNVRHDITSPQQILKCVTPPMPIELVDANGPYISFPLQVKVQNGAFPSGLLDSMPFFTYAKAPPHPENLYAFNLASRSIDIEWSPGGSVWDHMTYTGYVLKWREASSSTWQSSMVVGNITKTSVRGLRQNTTYSIGVSGLNEDQKNSTWWRSFDQYGRRKALEGALEGLIATIDARTLHADVDFSKFNANTTQNHGPVDARNRVWPGGLKTGGGHYGLTLVGDASIENCNASSSCCDKYDSNKNCASGYWTCQTITDSQSKHSHCTIANEDSSDRYAGIRAICGPALRLTGSSPRLTGAAWYPRTLEVGEGFVTTFKIQMSNPSTRCDNLEGLYQRCRSRGGGGFAFVVQGEGPYALGRDGLGYAGINNSLAVEFDTYYNFDDLDPYENHISVQTRGWRHPNDKNHNYSLGHTNAIPDLTDGIVSIKVVFVPRFDVVNLSKPSFMASPYVSHFFQNENYPVGLADWETPGLGMLYIYVMDLYEPKLIVPLHLIQTIHLERGRAYVGFTAATGDTTRQSHDIIDWSFSSLRMDAYTFEPTVANGGESFQ